MEDWTNLIAAAGLLIAAAGFVLSVWNFRLWWTSKQQMLDFQQKQFDAQQQQPLRDYKFSIAQKSNNLFMKLESELFREILYLYRINLETVESPLPSRVSSVNLFREWQFDNDDLIKEIHSLEPVFRTYFETDDILNRNMSSGSLFEKLSSLLDELGELSHLLDKYYQSWHDPKRVRSEEAKEEAFKLAKNKYDYVSQYAHGLIRDALKYCDPESTLTGSRDTEQSSENVRPHAGFSSSGGINE